MERVICNKAETCLAEPADSYCNARVPHFKSPECGQCQFDPEQECVPVETEIENQNET